MATPPKPCPCLTRRGWKNQPTPSPTQLRILVDGISSCGSLADLPGRAALSGFTPDDLLLLGEAVARHRPRRPRRPVAAAGIDIGTATSSLAVIRPARRSPHASMTSVSCDVVSDEEIDGFLARHFPRTTA